MKDDPESSAKIVKKAPSPRAGIPLFNSGSKGKREGISTRGKPMGFLDWPRWSQGKKVFLECAAGFDMSQ